MNLTSPRIVKDILAEHGLTPSRGLGQNFLVDKNVIGKLISAANIQPEDTVVEIGPGIGTLTKELSKLAGRVIAIEKDAQMVRILQETITDKQNVNIIHGDALKLSHAKYKIQDTKYKIVANLPYYITAPTIRKFLEASKVKPYSMTLIVQKEVAQRICARPPHMNILAVSVQIYAKPTIISYVKKSAFWPQPKVDAAILQTTPHPQLYPIDFPKFFTIVKAGFKQPRKQIVNNLSTSLALSREQTKQWLLQNNIKPTQRAETLSIEDWISLTKSLPE